MREELIKRLRFMGDASNGSIDHRTIREAADALARPAPVQVSMPDGWKLERNGEAIIVGKHGVGGCVVKQRPTESREIPESILWMLADALLAAAPSAPVAVAQEFDAIDDADLDGMEKWLTERGAQNAAFFPADANRLANMTLHMIREVRAARTGAPASPSVDAEKVMGLVRDYGRHCERYGHDGPMYEEIRALLTPATCKTSLQVDGWIPVPIEALQWLFGVHDDGFDWPNSNRLKYGFRSEFARRAGIDSVAVIDWKPAIANQEPQDGR